MKKFELICSRAWLQMNIYDTMSSKLDTKMMTLITLRCIPSQPRHLSANMHIWLVNHSTVVTEAQKQVVFEFWFQQRGHLAPSDIMIKCRIYIWKPPESEKTLTTIIWTISLVLTDAELPAHASRPVVNTQKTAMMPWQCNNDLQAAILDTMGFKQCWDLSHEGHNI